ncbi:DUF6193 family natural product biosynthesis protein [Streptomyces sp. NPDC002623]
METNDTSPRPDLSLFLDSALYPDLIERGGLVSALESLARESGLDVGTPYSEHASGPGRYRSAVIATDRGTMSMLLGKRERMFSLDIRGRGFTWADGMTDDLRELVGAVAAWRSGLPVDEFAGAFPFMRLGRLARGYESGDPIAAQWEWLRTAEVYDRERPLVEAAHANGRLRGLFPYLSHGVLRLSTELGRQGAREIQICPVSGGSYQVEDTGSGDGVRNAVALGEAIDTAVDLLLTSS